MDVITDARPIRSWIIDPENLNLRPMAGSGLKCKRDQVRFRIVIFSEFSVRIGTRRIEVAQRKVLQPMSFVEPSHCPLKCELRFAVRIDGILRMVFRDWHSLGHSVRCARGRKDQESDAAFFHGPQEVQTTNQVCLVIRLRQLCRFSYQSFACKMQDTVNRVLTKNLLEI